MKTLAFRGVYTPSQNALFKQGNSDGLFNARPRSNDEHYLQGYETGRKLRLEMKNAGANVSVQFALPFPTRRQ